MSKTIRGSWLVVLVAIVAGSATPARAQFVPPADPADVESIDAIMKAVYDVISGAAGERRDWNRFQSLFIPDGRLMPSGPRAGGLNNYQVWTPAEYAQRAGPGLMQNGFFEVEISRVTEQFGHIAHVFSSYESRRNENDAEPFARGINSFQLMHDGNRWWVVSIYWTGERPDLPIPAKYLPAN